MQRNQAFLIQQHLDAAAIDVDLRDLAKLQAPNVLLIKGVGSRELGARRLHPRAGGNHLKIGAGNRENHQILRILGGKVAGAHQLPGGTIIVDRREIGDALREPPAHIQNIERSDHVRQREPGKTEVETDGSQIEGLLRVSDIGAEVRQQSTPGRFRLTTHLAQGLGHAHGAEVVGEAAPDRFRQRQLPRKRNRRRAVGAPAVGA